MVNRSTPTSFFWNCLGCCLVLASLGVSISVARTEALELEVARYKLKTGSALNKVQKASDKLEETALTLPIDNGTKQAIQKKIEQADRAIIEAENEIEQKVLKLNTEE